MDKHIYPIGKFEYGKTYSAAETTQHIAAIEQLPAKLKELANQLSSAQLQKSYRPGGWNAQQIIHHIADSHSNALIRVKLALTENTPVIKPYNQDAWAELADVQLPVAVSVQMTEAIHQRWIALLKSMKPEDFNKTYIHPEYNKEFKLSEFVALYAWHGDHHCGHLQVILNQA